MFAMASAVSIPPVRDRSVQDQNQQSNPNYSFAYVVRDRRTGDQKSHHEKRQGDRVQGQYRVIETDGTERIVDYTADDRNGFNAKVRHQPAAHQLLQLVPISELQKDSTIDSNARLLQPCVFVSRIYRD